MRSTPGHLARYPTVNVDTAMMQCTSRICRCYVIQKSRALIADCYNKKYREGEHPGHKPFSKKQFQRFSREEFTKAMQNMDPEVAKLTERAARNPKRSQDEILHGMRKLAESRMTTLKASTDYLAAIGDGLSGWYCCRSEKSLEESEILRVKLCPETTWRTPTSTEKQHLHLTRTCSDVIVPMNHWFRGGVNKSFRCPINFANSSRRPTKKAVPVASIWSYSIRPAASISSEPRRPWA